MTTTNHMKIKYILTLLATLLLCVGYSHAATELPKLKPSDFYSAKEVSVDVFGTASISKLSQLRSFDGPAYGAGVGVNWFPWRTAGVGVEAQADDISGGAVDRLGVKLLGRLPVNRFAFTYGVGSQYDFGPKSWAVFAEAGPELRLSKHVGLFATVRGVKPIDAPESIAGLVGIRVH